MARRGARVALLGLVAVLAALLLSACGGSDDSTTADNDDYAAQVQAVTTSFANGFDELSADAANPTSAADFRDSVIAIQDRITETIDDLKAITPPEELADDHEQLVQVFVDYRDGYDPIVEALDAKDPAALKTAAQAIPGVVQDFQTTYTEIKGRMADAGVTIEVEPTGGDSTDSTTGGTTDTVPAN